MKYKRRARTLKFLSEAACSRLTDSRCSFSGVWVPWALYLSTFAWGGLVAGGKCCISSPLFRSQLSRLLSEMQSQSTTCQRGRLGSSLCRISMRLKSIKGLSGGMSLIVL